MNGVFSSKRRAAFLLAGAVLAGGFVAAPEARADDIPLGFLGDLSATPNAAIGRAGVLGLQTAIDDINKAGGVLGRQLTLVTRDDQGQPARSIPGASELVESVKVAAFFGVTHSGNALAWKRLVDEKHTIAYITIAEASSVTAPLNADTPNYIFRGGTYDRAQAAAFVAYAKKSNAKNVGILTETTNYGEGGLHDLSDIAKLQNVNVVATNKFAVSDTDMTSQLIKMRDAGVDCLLVWAQANPTAQLMRSMDKLGYYPRILGAGGVPVPGFYDSAGPKLGSMPLSTRVFVTPTTDAQKQLFERVKDKLPDPSLFYSTAINYDAVMVISAAIRQAGSTDGTAVHDALENLKEPVKGYVKTYDRPFSKITHEALVPSDITFVKWQDGKLGNYHDAVTDSITENDYKQ
jgi:branched-chain amino acid transport system substrate-binding protein